MNNANPSSSPASLIHGLPKLAALSFIVCWGIWGGELPMVRLGLVLGLLALFDALTGAAARNQQVLLDWSDLPLVLRQLLAPTALPLYAIVAAGVIYLGGDPQTGPRGSATTTPERGTVPQRVAPTSRAPMTTPPGWGSRPGMPTPPKVNYGPKALPSSTSGASSPTQPPRPTFAPPRPPQPPPSATAVPQPPSTRAVPPSSPTATATPTAVPGTPTPTPAPTAPKP